MQNRGVAEELLTYLSAHSSPLHFYLTPGLSDPRFLAEECVASTDLAEVTPEIDLLSNAF